MGQFATNRSLLVFTATVLALIAWLLLVLLPGNREVQSYADRSAQLETELQQLHTLFLTAGQSAELSETAQLQTSRTLAQLMSDDSLEQFIDLLSTKLAARGLRQVTIRPVVEEVLAHRKVVVGDQQLTRVLLQVALVGRFLDIGKAVEYLEHQSYFSEFRSINLGYDDELNPAIACQFDVTVYLRSKGDS